MVQAAGHVVLPAAGAGQEKVRFGVKRPAFQALTHTGLCRRQIMAGVHATGADGIPQPQQLDEIAARVAELMELQRKCLCDVLLPELEEHGIKIVAVKDVSKTERQRLDQFFESQVYPVLTPLAVDPAIPHPYIGNLALSLAIRIHDPATKSSRLARIKVPKSLPRWVPYGEKNHFVPLEQLVAANLESLFPGMEVGECRAFRVTRYSDLELPVFDDDDDLLSAIEEQVFERRFAEVVRVEVEKGTSAELRELILSELREGMVFSMHPHVIAENGRDCLYMQDTWLVTADAGEPLAGLPMKLF